MRSNLYSHAVLNAGAGGRLPSYQPQLRVLLNRNLTPYPGVNAATGLIDPTPANAARITQAVNDRTNLATDIYNMLVKVTGVGDPTTIQWFKSIPSNNDTNYQNRQSDKNAARWLAQLALNIVDFIDEDDYMTPWNWCAGSNKDLDNPYSVPEYLFGTELGHLLINEVYAQLDNDVKDPSINDNKGAAAEGPEGHELLRQFLGRIAQSLQGTCCGCRFSKRQRQGDYPKRRAE